MKAALITIGDELLIGQVVNTNASWIGERCAERGIEVCRMSTVGDSAEAITRELKEGISLADVIFVTGGLGPTHDDITCRVVADFFGVPCELDTEILATVRARFERIGIPMPESNVSQAMVPLGFRALENPKGSAPGLWNSFMEGGRERQVFLTPGVPHEMKTMFVNEILPKISPDGLSTGIVSRTILVTGMGESTLADRLGPLDEFLGPDVTLAYLPGINRVRLRIMAFPKRDAGSLQRMQALDRRIHKLIGAYIYGYGEDTLEGAVAATLIEHRLTIATAESCTGGLLSSRLTDIPGASTYMLGGVVSYSNESKIRDLGVLEDTLREYGAVSRDVALEMAVGVRTRFRSDLGVSLTGILGPDGGTDEKPVGTVWIAIATKDSSESRKLSLGVDRLRNKERATMSVLDMIRRAVMSSALADRSH